MTLIQPLIDIIKTDWHILVCLFLFSYVIRSLFLTIESGDINYTLYQFKKTRKNKFGQHFAKDSVTEGVIAYPTLLHWFYSRVPTQFRISTAYFLNTSYDCINVVLFYQAGNNSGTKEAPCLWGTQPFDLNPFPGTSFPHWLQPVLE